MIHPDSLLKKLWDLLVLAGALSSALIVPIVLVFPLYPVEYLRYFSLGISVLFFLDILVNFGTAGHYLRRGFLPDLLAVVPVLSISAELFPGWWEAGAVSFAPERLFALNILFKLPRAAGVLKRIGGNRINPAILRLFLLGFWVLLAAHLISCLWILVSGNPGGLPPFDRYVAAFYWTVTTLTTIGYGDITPKGTEQMIFVVIVQLFGAGMYGLIIGNIANLIANIDVAKAQYKEKMDKVNAFLKYRSIPPALQKKVGAYYDYLWETRRGYDEISFLENLPPALKEQVALHLNKDLIEKVPIFEKAEDSLIRDIILKLKPAVFLPGDRIVHAGEMGSEMYFISRGSVEVLSPDEKTRYAELHAGQFFGEIALLLSMPRTATIRSLDFCDLYKLDKDTFDTVLARHPGFKETIAELAEKRKHEVEALRAQRSAEQSGKVPVPSEPPPDPLMPLVRAVRKGETILLIWNDIPKSEKYEVARLNAGTGKWRIEGTNLNRPAYSLDPFRVSSTYRVRAVLHSGEGPWSNPIKASPAFP
jgi:voltage-gated potassium channel